VDCLQLQVAAISLSLSLEQNIEGKSLNHSRTIDPRTHNPRAMKRSNLPPQLSKTVYFTLWAGFGGGFATVTLGCYGNNGFVFFIYFR
jgi:hypothetical protein